jgi:Family of unknown function (DUF5675)
MQTGGALTLQRIEFRDWGTTGRVHLNDRWFCDSLEPPSRGNEEGRSCIPAGAYIAYATRDLAQPGRVGMNVYELKDVPGRRNVQINSATIMAAAWAGDVTMGLYFNLRGLITLGEGYEMLQPPLNGFRPQLALLHTQAILASFMRQTHGYGITVRILDPEV